MSRSRVFAALRGASGSCSTGCWIAPSTSSERTVRCCSSPGGSGVRNAYRGGTKRCPECSRGPSRPWWSRSSLESRLSSCSPRLRRLWPVRLRPRLLPRAPTTAPPATAPPASAPRPTASATAVAVATPRPPPSAVAGSAVRRPADMPFEPACAPIQLDMLACANSVGGGQRYDSLDFSEPFEFVMPVSDQSGSWANLGVTARSPRKGVLRHRQRLAAGRQHSSTTSPSSPTSATSSTLLRTSRRAESSDTQAWPACSSRESRQASAPRLTAGHWRPG